MDSSFDERVSIFRKISAVVTIVLGILLVRLASIFLITFPLQLSHVIMNGCMVTGGLALIAVGTSLLFLRCVFKKFKIYEETVQISATKYLEVVMVKSNYKQA